MISVIISIYKNLDNLDLILQALAKQSYPDFEVVVSEDNNAQETINFLQAASKKYEFPIKHVNQEDKGFRKTKILNRAVMEAAGEYLVFLDGDCMPHKHLLRSYSKFLKPNRVCMGKRCALNEKITKKLHHKHSVERMNPLLFIANSLNPESGVYMPWEKQKQNHQLILGCNFALPRQLLIDINGFDEDYCMAGVGEDHDIDWRLRKHGAEFLNIKHRVIVYHLYHKENYNSETTLAVNILLDEKLKQGNIICKNGIHKSGAEDSTNNLTDILNAIRKQKEQIEMNAQNLTEEDIKLRNEVFNHFYFMGDDAAINILIIKKLNMLTEYNLYRLDPSKENIVISLSGLTERELQATKNKEQEIIESIGNQSVKTQLLIISKTEKEAEVAERLVAQNPTSYRHIKQPSYKEVISFIAQAKLLISNDIRDIQLAKILNTDNILINR